MRPPARRGHRGLRPGGKVEKKKVGRWEDGRMRRRGRRGKSKTAGWGDTRYQMPVVAERRSRGSGDASVLIPDAEGGEKRGLGAGKTGRGGDWDWNN